MSWLSKATGIHIGGDWGISRALDRGYAATGLKTMLGNMAASTLDRTKSLFQGNLKGTISGVTRGQFAGELASQIAAARNAAHDSEVAQLAQNALGPVALRRKRGPLSTMLTGSPSLAATVMPTSTKSMLSQ